MSPSRHVRSTLLLALAALLPGAAGCAGTYIVPGRGADLSVMGLTAKTRAELTESSIREILDRRPLTGFPASMAVVRVQSAGYRSATAQGYGGGRYSVVLERDIEKDEDVESLEKLPEVRDVALLGRLLLPESLQSDLELRRAAAALRADMLLVYTLDTTFRVEDRAKPLTVVSLGLLPSKKTWVQTTAAALLLDVRNGYVYGVAEATRKQDGTASAWSSRDAVDRSRRETEAGAFAALVDDLEGMWGRIVEETRNAPPPAARLEPRKRAAPRSSRRYATDGG